MANKTIIQGRYGTGAGEFGDIYKDPDNDTLITSEFLDYMLHQGHRFYHKGWLDIPANGILDIRAVTPNNVNHIHVSFGYQTEAEFTFTIYEGAVIHTAGTDGTAFNRNRNSANLSGIALTYVINPDLATANLDTVVATATALETSKSGSAIAIAAPALTRIGLILARNMTYCLRFENDTAAIRYVDWEFDWYEHAAHA